MIENADHVCAVCESDCDLVTALRQRVRDLERHALTLSYMLATFEQAINLPNGKTHEWFPSSGAVR